MQVHNRTSTDLTFRDAGARNDLHFEIHVSANTRLWLTSSTRILFSHFSYCGSLAQCHSTLSTVLSSQQHLRLCLKFTMVHCGCTMGDFCGKMRLRFHFMAVTAGCSMLPEKGCSSLLWKRRIGRFGRICLSRPMHLIECCN